ncbi:hypothetical protein DYB34_009422 [Aphanomyces astaci]|uniref:Uncharacterized protein n=1 Tax=Aphanomyces astaci TaxID=112090 RepID=A0A397EQ97_APHAT|nr:hypothetical protein DYB34_009422 [Aphanomyces astaci]RHY96175.1 hypothetical protein DYB31_012915 [Aphanomyces astaci]
MEVYHLNGLVQGDDGRLFLNGKPIHRTKATLETFGNHATQMPAKSLISEWFNPANVLPIGKIHVLVAQPEDLPGANLYLAPLEDISWCDVGSVFEHYMIHYKEFPREAIPPEPMGALDASLKLATKALGSVATSDDWTRVFFIAPILIHVACLVDGVHMVTQEKVIGKRIKVYGQLDFVLRRGETRICIMQAKYDDMEKAMAQVLMGCEAMADMQNLDVVYAIATNGVKWMFYKRKVNEIREMEAEIQFGDGHRPTLEYLERVAETIHGMLVKQ